MPWNQRSLEIYDRAVEWAGSLRELFSIVASAKFDIGCSGTYTEGGREKAKERERELPVVSCKCLVGAQGDVLGTEKFRTWYVKGRGLRVCIEKEMVPQEMVGRVVPPVSQYEAQPMSFHCGHGAGLFSLG